MKKSCARKPASEVARWLLMVFFAEAAQEKRNKDTDNFHYR
jgi:hypothetical protein